jgi:hypothetical protein
VSIPVADGDKGQAARTNVLYSGVMIPVGENQGCTIPMRIPSCRQSGWSARMAPSTPCFVVPYMVPPCIGCQEAARGHEHVAERTGRVYTPIEPSSTIARMAPDFGFCFR